MILHDMHPKAISLNESFQVTSLILKLLSLWKDFRNYLKDKCKEMNLEDSIV